MCRFCAGAELVIGSFADDGSCAVREANVDFEVIESIAKDVLGTFETFFVGFLGDGAYFVGCCSWSES